MIDNRNGGMIGSNAAISFTVSGAVTTDAGNANFSILRRQREFRRRIDQCQRRLDEYR